MRWYRTACTTVSGCTAISRCGDISAVTSNLLRDGGFGLRVSFSSAGAWSGELLVLGWAYLLSMPRVSAAVTSTANRDRRSSYDQTQCSLSAGGTAASVRVSRRGAYSAACRAYS